MKTGLWVAVALVVVVYAAFVVANNGEGVPLDLLFLKLEAVPVWQLLLSSLLLGVAVSTLVLAIPLVRLRLRSRGQSRRITRLEQEVHGLRTLPLAETDEAETRPTAREG